MKYQIEGFVLDTKTRKITGPDGEQSIRPKTLAMLLVLARNNTEVISKQALLDQIWQDVKVDDGVIFQSVREIRKIFADATIVQNHGRRGYQFTSELKPLQNNGKSGASGPKPQLIWLAVTVSVCFFVFLLFTLQNESSPKPPETGVIVLPVVNQVHYGAEQWDKFTAMEKLIFHLEQIEGFNHNHHVYQGSDVLQLINSAEGLAHDKVFSATGAGVVVESELRGNAHDYKLVYKIHRAAGTSQGVILDASIDSALAQLALKVDQISSTQGPQPREFSRALLSEAMKSYESDWHTSVSFFESYLALNPNSYIASVYLSKLYIWQGKTAQARVLVDELYANYDAFSAQQRAQIALLKGRIAAKGEALNNALKWYELAQQQVHQDGFLAGNIALEKGLALLAQCRLAEAQQALVQALNWFEKIHSPIGINSTLLPLAQVKKWQSQEREAQQLLTLAKQNIMAIELEFLYTMLEDYEGKIQADSGVLSCTTGAK